VRRFEAYHGDRISVCHSSVCLSHLRSTPEQLNVSKHVVHDTVFLVFEGKFCSLESKD